MRRPHQRTFLVKRMNLAGCNLMFYVTRNCNNDLIESNDFSSIGAWISMPSSQKDNKGVWLNIFQDDNRCRRVKVSHRIHCPVQEYPMRVYIVSSEYLLSLLGGACDEKSPVALRHV